MAKHVDLGWRCLVAHGDHGPCLKCATCYQWISPLEWDSECPGFINERQAKFAKEDAEEIEKLKKMFSK